MKRLLLLPLAILALTTNARSQTPATPEKPASDTPTVQRSGPGQATASRVFTQKAKVTAVDQEKRTLTVEGKDGKPVTFAVSSKVKRLNEIAPGDTIVVKYEQGLLLQAAAEGSTGPSGSVELNKAGAEKAPGVEGKAQVRGQVTVNSVDKKTREVVLETPKGELVKVKADPTIDLSKVKKGMKLDGVYSESLAVSVEKAKPAAAKK